MGDYERSTTVDADRDEIFAFLSKVENLPAYMDRLTSARMVSKDEVAVEARLEPQDAGAGEGRDAGSGEQPEDDEARGPDRTVQGQAWFRVDERNHSLSWGAEGPHDYHGELEVVGDSSASTVTVRLHTLHDDAPAIENGLDETLANIVRHVAAGRA